MDQPDDDAPPMQALCNELLTVCDQHVPEPEMLRIRLGALALAVGRLAALNSDVVDEEELDSVLEIAREEYRYRRSLA
jgi:hypothetical protein